MSTHAVDYAHLDLSIVVHAVFPSPQHVPLELGRRQNAHRQVHSESVVQTLHTVIDVSLAYPEARPENVHECRAKPRGHGTVENEVDRTVDQRQKIEHFPDGRIDGEVDVGEEAAESGEKRLGYFSEQKDEQDRCQHNGSTTGERRGLRHAAPLPQRCRGRRRQRRAILQQSALSTVRHHRHSQR